jgi:tetratricopeptide (TPR) repeat protein
VRRAHRVAGVVILLAAVAAAGGVWTAHQTAGTRGDPELRRVRDPAGAPDALLRHAMQLYSAREFARACDGFRAAADEEPANLERRADIGRCFETWGWDALREGRADEALVLFRQGLRETPGSQGLLRGSGVAAVHSGVPDEAIAPLEQVISGSHDTEVRLLLAHLYDRRGDAEHAAIHIDALLASEPSHGTARRLRAKLDRERRTESGFRRERRGGFVIKSPLDTDNGRRRTVLAMLERARASIAADLAHEPTEPVTVVLYAPDALRGVTGAHGWAAAVFDGKIRLPVAADSDATLERLVVHEYAHAVIHDLARGRAPRWLQEGLAQLLEGADFDPLLRIPVSITLPGVEALVTDHDVMRARAGYDIALWIVRDLVDRAGMAGIRDMLVQIGRGESLDSAVARVYGVRLAELESQWRRVLGG